MRTYFSKLNYILSKKDKRYLLSLFIFSLIIALVETAGVSVIMPYISVATDMSLIDSNQYYSYVFNFFGFNDKINFVIILGLCIIIFYIFRAILNISYMYLIMKFTFSRYYFIINKLFKNYLTMPYTDFIQTNTSQLTKMIINEAQYLTELIKSTLLLFSEVFVFIFIYSILLYINYEIILSINVIIVIIGFILLKTVSKVTKENGKKREKFQKIFYEVLNKSFNNIKMIKLQDTNTPLRDFNKSSKAYTDTVMINSTIQHIPRLTFEFVGFSIVVGIVMYLLFHFQTDISSHYATITIFVLGMYRLLPSVTKILLNYNHILFYYKSLDLIYKDYYLNSEKLGTETINYSNLIKLKNIEFSYGTGLNIIKSLSLEIKKNEKIALIGESGSGKSTLVDIIMGLHKVTAGEIEIDQTKLTDNNLANWRNHFGYIPQSIYLFDGTVAQNITFGLDINKSRVIEVLKQVNLWDILQKKEGIDTRVGESGIMLSGGQRQRIAIARALYKNPDILVLDEATSALDDETESKIMNEIYEISKNKTLIIIAHRLSTIRRCEKVYEMKNGKIRLL